MDTVQFAFNQVMGFSDSVKRNRCGDYGCPNAQYREMTDSEIRQQEKLVMAMVTAVEYADAASDVAGLPGLVKGAFKLAFKGGLKAAVEACCCFAAGTLIYTERGLIPIEEIQVGDLVWARDTKTGETALKPVTQLFYTPAKALYALVTVNELGMEERVEVTDNHPYFVIGHGWLDSIELIPGMQIESFDKSVLTVNSMQSFGGSEVTYNFTVGDFHTYFVGEQRALVHNYSCFGHLVSWGKMSAAQQRAFQHSYSNHAKDFGLPNWTQKSATQLQEQFNAAVSKVRNTGTQLPGPIFKPWKNGSSVEVNYFESVIDNKKYYYYEDKISGAFISSGLSR